MALVGSDVDVLLRHSSLRVPRPRASVLTMLTVLTVLDQGEATCSGACAAVAS